MKIEFIEITGVCPVCGGVELGPTGLLGALAHYHCRQCGMSWSEPLGSGAVARLSYPQEATI